MHDEFRNLSTIAAAAIGAEVPSTGDIAPHVKPATTYEKDKGYLYYRNDGPGLSDAEAVVNKLEGGAGALLFSSGMAAATHLLIALGQGSHILVPETMYWFLRYWTENQGAAFGLTFTRYPNGDIDAVRAAVAEHKPAAVWVETPANPDWSITDLAAVAEIAHAAGAKMFVDSTCATPILTRPIEFGADVVMHSATKYLNGHSDVLAGALVTRAADNFWEQVTHTRTGLGSTLGAFEAWLLLRGLRTLDVRVKRQCENAMRIAEVFAEHPLIRKVNYPGLRSDPGHDVAKKQMTGGFGGMLSICVNGGGDAAARAVTRTKLFRNATSLGGVESLVEHRAPVEGPTTPTPQDLLRLSVGLEDADDLIADLEQALGQ